jgi:hypothetical protein
VSFIFSIYFGCSEINDRMGDGALRSLFFDPPRIGTDSSHSEP